MRAWKRASIGWSRSQPIAGRGWLRVNRPNRRSAHGTQGPTRYWKVGGLVLARLAEPIPSKPSITPIFSGWALCGGGGGAPVTQLPTGHGRLLDDRYVNIDGDTMTGGSSSFRRRCRPWNEQASAHEVPPATDTISASSPSPRLTACNMSAMDGGRCGWPSHRASNSAMASTVDGRKPRTSSISSQRPDFSIGGIKEPPQTAPGPEGLRPPLSTRLPPRAGNGPNALRPAIQFRPRSRIR